MRPDFFISALSATQNQPNANWNCKALQQKLHSSVMRENYLMNGKSRRTKTGGEKH
jgi:hypothetical protein